MPRTRRASRTTPRAKLARTIGQVRKTLSSGATQFRQRASRALSQLEGVFQSRVEAVITRLGLPRAEDVRELSLQVAQLQQRVDHLRRPRARS